jgi:hypothetical protein
MTPLLGESGDNDLCTFVPLVQVFTNPSFLSSLASPRNIALSPPHMCCNKEVVCGVCWMIYICVADIVEISFVISVQNFSETLLRLKLWFGMHQRNI